MLMTSNTGSSRRLPPFSSIITKLHSMLYAMHLQYINVFAEYFAIVKIFWQCLWNQEIFLHCFWDASVIYLCPLLIINCSQDSLRPWLLQPDKSLSLVIEARIIFFHGLKCIASWFWQQCYRLWRKCFPTCCGLYRDSVPRFFNSGFFYIKHLP